MTVKSPPTPRPITALRGKRVAFFRLAKSSSGFRTGRVRKVTVAGKKAPRLVSLLVETAGGRFRVEPRELTLTNHPTGVLWMGALVRLEDWLAGHNRTQERVR